MAAPVAQDQLIRGDLAELPASVPLSVSANVTASGTMEFGLERKARIVEVTVVQSAAAGGPSYTVGIDGWNPADNSWENLITSAAVTGTGALTTVVQVNPYAPPITNSSAQRVVRRRMRVNITVSAGNFTGSVNIHASA